MDLVRALQRVAREVRQEADLPTLFRARADLGELRPVKEATSLLPAADRRPKDGLQKIRFVAEAGVDRLYRDVGFRSDRLNRRPRESQLGEEGRGGVDDPAPGLLSPLRPARPRGLDSL